MWKLLTVGLLLAACSSRGCGTSIFYSSKDASQVLRIQKRANTFLEELKPGSVERECVEEHCDFEEASEIFETREATMNFWTKYVDGDQCAKHPCSNGICKDNIGKFSCICNKGWEGVLCSYEVKYSNCSLDNGGCEHFCREDPAEQHRLCSCASGYQLKDDHTTCEPVVEFPCGRVKSDYLEAKADFNIRLIDGKVGRKGGSPWQIMLQNAEGMFLCGGVLIHPAWVLTAAHCLEEQKVFKVKLVPPGVHPGFLEFNTLEVDNPPGIKGCPPGGAGTCHCSVKGVTLGWWVPQDGDKLVAVLLYRVCDPTGSVFLHSHSAFLRGDGKFRFRSEADEQTIWVDKWVIHENYTKKTSDNDIAMLHLAEHVMYYKYALPLCLPTRSLAERELMRSGKQAVVTGWGRRSEHNSSYAASLSYIEIPIVPRNECAQAMSSHISDNMLCAGSLGDRKDSCIGDSGGPMFTRYKDTWFLVGLVSWGEGCGRRGKFGVYTKVSQYLEWINHHIDMSAPLKG